MSTALIFYPYCHIKSTSKQILVYDSVCGQYVFHKTNPLSYANRHNIISGYIIPDEGCNGFVEECLAKHLGYLCEFSEVLPFMHKRTLDFVSSLKKERESLGYNLQSSTNPLLKSVTLLLNNSCDSYSKEECLQMDYPDYNSCDIDIASVLEQLSLFPSLETIILSGEIDSVQLELVLDYAKAHGISIIHRLLYNSALSKELDTIRSRHGNYSVEFLLDGKSDLNSVSEYSDNRTYYKAIISSVDDIAKFDNLTDTDFTYIPVLSSNIDELISLMQMSEEEILKTPKSLETCLFADYINMNAYGHLTICYDGSIMCLGKKYASIHDVDLSQFVNRWVGLDDCTWYYSRKKKEKCADCALQCLCPAISVYEELGLIDSPCAYSKE